jgi:uncharacterized protein with ParB-like and HNH nuclease domain
VGLIVTPIWNVKTSKMNDEIDIAPVKSEADDNETPLRPYEILSFPADFTLEVLVEKWKKGEIKSPRLQRRFIWPIERASKLIESFLLGLPVPAIFVYQDRDDNSLLIVDGHQRLRSIIYFFSGWFGDDNDPKREPFKLTGLNDKSPFRGFDIERLKNTDPASMNRLKNSVLRAFIMKQLHPQDDTSIIEVFERLNTGGVTLQGQEVRNCIYEGAFNEQLKKFNKNDDWRKILGTVVEDKRMRDVELILRFLALFFNINNYEKPMKGFLNKFMKANRRAPEEQKNDTAAKKKSIAKKQKDFAARMGEFENLFTRTAKAVVKYLGSKPFHVRRGLNAAVFDSVFTAFARHLDELDLEKPSAAKIKKAESNFRRLLQDAEYIKSISSATTDKDVVPQRLNKAEEFLFG